LALHKLSSGPVTPDTSVVVDFSLTDNADLFTELFGGRMLLSDFVESELAAADIQLAGAEVVRIERDDEWTFYLGLRKTKPGLGTGELGALTVARFRGAILLTNDRPARQVAEALGISYSGGLGVLEFAFEIGRISGEDAVRILDQMIAAGARIADDLVSGFRSRVRGEK
jgi:predicted nucleic acid-binding protein